MTALQFVLEPVISPFRDVATLAAFGFCMLVIIVVACVSFTFCLLLSAAFHFSQEPIEDTVAYAKDLRRREGRG